MIAIGPAGPAWLKVRAFEVDESLRPPIKRLLSEGEPLAKSTVRLSGSP